MTTGIVVKAESKNELSFSEFPIFNTTGTVEKEIYHIVHKIPGRLRIRLDRVGWDSEYSNRLQGLIKKTSIITESRVNPAASSLIVCYCSESVSEADVINCLEKLIQTAIDIDNAIEEDLPVNEGSRESWTNICLAGLTLSVAIASSVWELPFFLVGGLVLAASIPLVQKVEKAVTHREQVTVECLDALWLTGQLIQGNGIAAALALNLGGAGEMLRQTKLIELEQEVYELRHEQQSAQEYWLNSLEQTQLMQQVKPIAEGAIAPTLILSGVVGILTNDLAKACALLPLDLGVSLRGVTPLAVVSALATAARRGIYIRDGKTLEKLAQVDTLVISIFSFPEDKRYLVNIINDLSSLDKQIYIITNTKYDICEIAGTEVFMVCNEQEIKDFVENLSRLGRKVALIDNSTYNHHEIPCAVLISPDGENNREIDIVLHSYDLHSLSYVLELAKHTFSRAYESLAISIVPNLMAVIIGVIYGLDPIIAVLINGGSAILAELNSIKGYEKKLKPITSQLTI